MTNPLQSQAPNKTSLEKISPKKFISLAVILGAVALLTIGFLAHFNILHQIGSLSQKQIETGTALGFGISALGGGTYLVFPRTMSSDETTPYYLRTF